jgi:hypothetical protein
VFLSLAQGRAARMALAPLTAVWIPQNSPGFVGTSRDSKTRKPVQERTFRYSTGPAGTPIHAFDSRWR